MNTLSLFKYGVLLVAGMGALVFGGALLLRRDLKWMAQAFFAALVLGAVLIFYAVRIEPNWIVVNRVVIHDGELAKSLKGVRIVQISDIHMEYGFGKRERQLIKKVNKLKPDLLFITGDFIDGLDQAPGMNTLISQFKARLGIWGVPGNTDHLFIDGKGLADVLRPAGIRILVNQAERLQVDVGKYFWLVGVDDPVEGFANLSEALGSVPPGSPEILLAHGPKIFEKAIQEKINLVLVGHTHGGQIGIPFLIHLSDYANRTPYMKGLFKKESTQMYVNRGIGTKMLNVRFLCRPEITLIEIKP